VTVLVFCCTEPGEEATGSHAVQVVGYDNERQAWLARNSWGSGFGMGGYFWVNFSAPGMCDGSDTFGLTFVPTREAPPVPRLQPAPGRPGCYTYNAQPGDYPEKLVDWFGLGQVGLQQLVRDNLNHMPELDRFTPGAPLLICNPDPSNWPAHTPTPSAMPMRPTLTLQRVNRASPGPIRSDFSYGLKPAISAGLNMTTGPQAFDSRNAWRGLSVLGPVKEQGTCSDIAGAFAVLAAAQTAAAVALNTSLPAASLSEQDLYFCTPRESKIFRACRTGMQLKEVLESLLLRQRTKKPVVLDECLPYRPDGGAEGACRYLCTSTAAQAWLGTWVATPLASVAAMQRHIQTHGSIICRLQVFTDLRGFYEDNPHGIYRGPGAWLAARRVRLLVIRACHVVPLCWCPYQCPCPCCRALLA
jgi:hypothetical protein